MPMASDAGTAAASARRRDAGKMRFLECRLTLA
jgi:hypothetical protein